MKTKEELIEELCEKTVGKFTTLDGKKLFKEAISVIIDAHDREKPVNPWDDVIFHPDDPRAVIGEEYEFCDWGSYESRSIRTGELVKIGKNSVCPFYMTPTQNYMFIRPVRKPALKIEDILAKLTPEEAEFLVKAKSPWIEIKSHADLPPVEETVLWQYKNGDVTYFAIDKDSDLESLLVGYPRTGPIIRWMRVPE